MLEQIVLDTREYEDDGNVPYLVLGGSYWVYIVVKFTELNTLRSVRFIVSKFYLHKNKRAKTI